jgi:hypothetical protein
MWTILLGALPNWGRNKSSPLKASRATSRRQVTRGKLRPAACDNAISGVGRGEGLPGSFRTSILFNSTLASEGGSNSLRRLERHYSYRRRRNFWTRNAAKSRLPDVSEASHTTDDQSTALAQADRSAVR